MPIKRNPKVLITGGTSDIGAACARGFARLGWDVLLLFKSDEEKALSLKKELCALGIDATTQQADLSSREAVNKCVATISQLHPDCLINNAGTYFAQKDCIDMAFDDIQTSLAINFTAPFMLAAAAFKPMVEQGFGRIINISSIAAKYGGSKQSMHYGCAKRALEGVTKTLGREGAEHNVLVNTIRPGVIDTDFHARYPKDMAKRISMIPMKRMGLPEEVASLAVFLGSKTNTYITGQIVAVSGGE